MESRLCKVCKNVKELYTNFAINASFKNGRIAYKHSCNECRSFQKKNRLKLHSVHIKPDAGQCPICNELTYKWVLDHDHKTHAFRGWLCNTCNTALGKFNDDTNILYKAIAYLQKST